MVTRPSASYRAALAHLERLLAVTEEVHRTSRTLNPADRAASLGFVEETRALAVRAPHRVAGVEQLRRDLLCQWKEGVGEDVERFWALVEERGLDEERDRDVVAETLQRGRVLDMSQYAALDDAFEELQRCGRLTTKETDRLDAMLRAFEADPENEAYFDG